VHSVRWIRWLARGFDRGSVSQDLRGKGPSRRPRGQREFLEKTWLNREGFGTRIAAEIATGAR